MRRNRGRRPRGPSGAGVVDGSPRTRVDSLRESRPKSSPYRRPRRRRRLEPCYKQHTAVDDLKGVVLDVAVTTGEVNEGETIEAQIDAVREVSGCEVATVTGDAGYAYAKVYGGLERRAIDPVIPAKAEPIKSRVPLPLRRQARHPEMATRQDHAMAVHGAGIMISGPGAETGGDTTMPTVLCLANAPGPVLSERN